MTTPTYTQASAQIIAAGLTAMLGLALLACCLAGRKR